MQPKLEELKEDWLNKIVAERVPELKSKYTKKSGRTLFSNCVFSKGKRIYSEDSAIFIPLKREHICTGCLRYVGTFTQDRTLKLEERIYFRCPFGSHCKEVFCSETCVNEACYGIENDGIGWHSLTCVAELQPGQPLFELEALSKNSHETFLFVWRVLAQSIARASKKNGNVLSEILTLLSLNAPLPWSQLVVRSLYPELKDTRKFKEKDLTAFCNNFEEYMVSEGSKLVGINQGLIEDAWSLFDLGLRNKRNLPSTILEPFLDPALFFHVASAIEACALTLSSKSGHLHENRTEQIVSSIGNTNNTFSASEKTSFLMISPVMSILKHSCCPNSQLELECNPNSVSATLISLRAISRNEELTISYIPTNQNLVRRRSELYLRHNFICGCSRCKFESRQIQDIFMGELRFLSNQAYDESSYHDSELILNELIRLNTTEFDSLHNLGVSLFSRGKWRRAHHVWKIGYLQSPKNRILALQRNKERVFHVTCSEKSRKKGDERKNLKYNILARDIWTSDNILTLKQCNHWIQLAENYASTHNGWSANRHIGVPTTDIPICVIPQFLKEWNEVAQKIIIPRVARTLHLCTHKSCIRIHDAFIVKYTAESGQNYLPIHRDQSSYSITLALNDKKEFCGGGTYFEESKTTICPDLGNLVLFRGDILHGAAPITNGQRYIIAAFFCV